MIRVGLVGEDPNDTSSIKHLLEKKYSKKAQFFPLVKGIKGHQLDNPKIKRALPLEAKDKRCKFIVYIRDLDGFQSEKTKLQSKINWFKSLDSITNNNGVLLLNIWELEALILGDVTTFNRIYNCNYNFNGDPMLQKEPKEILIRATSHLNKKYKESHCPEIFKLVDIQNIEKHCKFFSDFIKKLDDAMES